MNRMKRTLSLFLTLALLAGMLCGCGSGSQNGTASGSQTDSISGSGSQNDHINSDGSDSVSVNGVSGSVDSSGSGADAVSPGQKLRIVTTIFPEYDWVRQILGEKAGNAALTLLMDKGVDLHSFQPTAEDMVRIATCDLFIYVGGESDQWAEDALKEAVNREMAVVNLLEVLGDAAKEEERTEGMQPERTDTAGDGAGEPEGPEYDEHVWLSLRNAALFCRHIAQRLGEIDPENREVYADNAAAYTEKLAALDQSYRDMVSASAKHTLLFGDRFPFRYLTEDYGLSYYAAFSGCSAETEASFETVVFLADKLDELGLSAVLTIESGDGKIARTVIESSRTKTARVLRLDSLQSVSRRDAENGTEYLGVMEDNLEVLREALA